MRRRTAVAYVVVGHVPRVLRVPLVVVALVGLPPVLARAAPALFTDSEAAILGLGLCYAAAALALNLVMGYAGQISLGHFALLGVGSFTAGILTSPTRLGLPFVLALPVASVAGAAVAFVVGLPALRLRGVYLAIVTIGFSYAMEESIFRYTRLTGGSSGVEVPRPLVGSFTFVRTGDYLGLLVLLLIGLWVVDTNVTKTRLGRAFQAIRADESVAASFGINVARYKLLAFVLSGAFAGVAGAMFGGLVGTISASSFDYQFSLLLVVIVVIGGLGSRPGVVISALAYVEVPRLLINVFGEGLRGWDLIIGAAGLMLAVSRHPGGVAEIIRERRERRDANEDDVAADLPSTLPDMPRPAARRDQADSPATVLRVSDVTVRFGAVNAVDGASLVVPKGQIVGLIGPNGAGKTTLFNAVSGLVRLTSGRIELMGVDVTESPAHARAAAGMGRTFQNIGLAKDLSILENLLLAQHSVATYGAAEALVGLGRSRGVERGLRDRAREAASVLGFGADADKPVRLLSQGQQRIVELGCVLLTAPELVMLDEPSAGMAPGAAENLAVRLRDIRDQLGRTVLIIEHNVPLVLDICDAITVLSTGSVIASGSVSEVAAHPEVISAYLGEGVSV